MFEHSTHFGSSTFTSEDHFQDASIPMLHHIAKRDGRIVPFATQKITEAIFKAAKSVGGTDRHKAEELAHAVVAYIKTRSDNPSVEQVQDAVEKVLIEHGHAATAKAYILYRHHRTLVRDGKSKLMHTLHDITYTDSKDLDLKRENANIDANSVMGTMLKYGSEAAKQYFHLHILNPTHSKAHQDGYIHIHDLDFLTLTTTCCQIDIDKILRNGFSTGHGYLREPNDIRTYSALACIVIQANQNDQYGGQSIPNFEYGLAPGVAKTFIRELDAILEVLDASEETRNNIRQTLRECLERDESVLEYAQSLSERFALDAISLDACVKKALKRTEKATFQAMEALVHNLNTMNSRAGAQIPFSSINYGTGTSPEQRMVIRNVLLATEAGLGHGETAIFPIHVFKVKEGVSYNEGDPNYDLFKLACRVSAKRLFPNFLFLDAPYNAQYYKAGQPDTEVATMGCRTRVMGNVHAPHQETTSGRGNISFTSINLPRIALESHGNVETFFTRLDQTITLVCNQLLERFAIQGSRKAKNFPFLMGQHVWKDAETLSPEDVVREVLKHGTLTIGFIGLAECLKALIGVHHGESDAAQELGKKIIAHMRECADAKSQETQLNFSLIATPAEGLSGRFVAIDRKLFGSIPGITDREYYTNSFHIPVYHPISINRKIRLEAPYHAYCNGGHITYVEVDGDPSQNLEAFEAIIRAMKEAHIGYGSINHPIDRDPQCGFSGHIKDLCPQCGREESPEAPFEHIRRITGYLVGSTSRFNNAKRAEERDRIKHRSDNQTPQA